MELYIDDILPKRWPITRAYTRSRIKRAIRARSTVNYQPDISVVIRARNEARHIGRVLDLIKRQDYDGNVEIIISIVVDVGEYSTVFVIKSFVYPNPIWIKLESNVIETA